MSCGLHSVVSVVSKCCLSVGSTKHLCVVQAQSLERCAFCIMLHVFQCISAQLHSQIKLTAHSAVFYGVVSIVSPDCVLPTALFFVLTSCCPVLLRHAVNTLLLCYCTQPVLFVMLVLALLCVVLSLMLPKTY